MKICLNKETGEHLSDEEILESFNTDEHWGLITSIDLFSCNPETIRSKEAIERFSRELCEYLEMKMYGDPVVVNFGEDPRIAGFSLLQLIETSNIAGHFANDTNHVYLDIFSCKAYGPKKAAEFCKEYFEAEKYNYNAILRSTS